MEKEIIDKFIKDIKDQVTGDSFRTDYCIIVYTSRSNGGKNVKYVYGTIVDFEEKHEYDISNIDVSLCIDFELWFFD